MFKQQEMPLKWTSTEVLRKNGTFTWRMRTSDHCRHAQIQSADEFQGLRRIGGGCEWRDHRRSGTGVANLIHWALKENKAHFSFNSLLRQSDALNWIQQRNPEWMKPFHTKLLSRRENTREKQINTVQYRVMVPRSRSHFRSSPSRAELPPNSWYFYPFAIVCCCSLVSLFRADDREGPVRPSSPLDQSQASRQNFSERTSVRSSWSSSPQGQTIWKLCFSVLFSWAGTAALPWKSRVEQHPHAPTAGPPRQRRASAR